MLNFLPKIVIVSPFIYVHHLPFWEYSSFLVMYIFWFFNTFVIWNKLLFSLIDCVWYRLYKLFFYPIVYSKNIWHIYYLKFSNFWNETFSHLSSERKKMTLLFQFFSKLKWKNIFDGKCCNHTQKIQFDNSLMKTVIITGAKKSF